MGDFLARPGQNGGLSLEDLEREEAARKEWTQWQARMKADFDKTAAFKGSPDLQAKAWERFLSAWGQDNPLSGEDEGLRAQAKGRMQERQQEAQRLAAASSPQEPFTYILQAGAYRTEVEAKDQQSRLHSKGYASAVSEREQSGRTVYRVRLGPYDTQTEAENRKIQLERDGFEAALVRVQR